MRAGWLVGTDRHRPMAWRGAGAMVQNGGKIVVIGGGIAGLCAGVYGLRCGYDVELVEMHDRLGGLATNWQRCGYTFETCLHWLLGSNPNHPMHGHWREVFDIGQLKFVHPEEYVRLETSDGRRLVLYTDPDRLEAELLREAPEDAHEIHGFVAAVREFRNLEIPEPPSTLANWLNLIATLPHLPAVNRWMGMTLKSFGERFQNPLLRRVFAGGETSGLSAIAVILTLAWMGRRDADYPIGGSQAVIQPIAESFRELGGRLRLGVRAQEILVDGDAAVGARLADGTYVRGDWVISAADGHATIYEMLHGRFVDKALDAAYETLEPFPSYLQVSLGVAMPLREQPHYVTQVLDAPIDVDPETTLDQLAFRVFNYDPTFAPPGCTAVTCLLPTRNHAYWTNLQWDDPARYQSEKQRLADAVISVFDRRAPGAGQAVEVVDVSTPASVIRYTGNWRGSMEGWLMTPHTGLRSLPIRLPGLQRFLMAGQWVAPGGGLPGGLMSARAAVQALCHEDGRPFRVNDPVATAKGSPVGAPH
jgi:phytoene dehydrogenase-like protein